MTLTPGAQRNLFGIFCFVLLIVYGIAWFAPAPGLPTEDGICLVAARALAAGHGYVADNLPTPITETRVPPLFPSLLALFTLVSQSTLWLRLLPLINSGMAVAYGPPPDQDRGINEWRAGHSRAYGGIAGRNLRPAQAWFPRLCSVAGWPQRFSRCWTTARLLPESARA